MYKFIKLFFLWFNVFKDIQKIHEIFFHVICKMSKRIGPYFLLKLKNFVIQNILN
ncbi:Uncharacterised protein [Mycobacterium tuberculosis]|nr:Uncharacterised protein [Mycobacterium tuberculosis]